MKKICHFAGQKRKYNVLLKGNPMNPGPLPNCQITIAEKRLQAINVCRATSDTPKNFMKLRRWMGVTLLCPHDFGMALWCIMVAHRYHTNLHIYFQFFLQNNCLKCNINIFFKSSIDFISIIKLISAFILNFV